MSHSKGVRLLLLMIEYSNVLLHFLLLHNKVSTIRFSLPVYISITFHCNVYAKYIVYWVCAKYIMPVGVLS